MSEPDVSGLAFKKGGVAGHFNVRKDRPMIQVVFSGNAVREKYNKKTKSRCFKYVPGERGSFGAAAKKARKWQRKKSRKLGLTKNEWAVRDGYLYVKLRGGRIMRTNAVAKAFALLKTHTWHAVLIGNVWYACAYHTDEQGKRTSRLFHTLYAGYVLCDHMNRQGLDNSIENLRPATSVENGRNCKMNKRNTSGITGVSSADHGKAWRATWNEDGGKVCVAQFSISVNGEEGAKRLASEARQAAETRLKIYNGNAPPRDPVSL